ncbi:Complement C1q-like protein 4 [Anabarilius grahami]|uniref:Complement C1q-like protein 4 n=1 Tax=Anabarilius grahami TaxID=495550 RepID=A0A3N0Z979_ANAGA|nr:Complement C1q-like protein 4 [Anabarilius grahami]
MKALVCILLLLETFVYVVQQQVDGGLNENEISQQISSEDGRQNPTASQQYCDLGIPDIHAALRELTATVTEQKGNIRELTATVTEQKANIRELTATVTEQKEINRALETRLRDAEQAAEQQTFILEELNKKNYEISNLTQSQVEELRKENRDREIAFSASLMQSGSGFIGPFTTEITLTYRNVFTNIGNAYNPITGIFTAPLKGAYMFRFSVYSHASQQNPSTAAIMKNGQLVVVAHDHQPQSVVNSSNGVVLILEIAAGSAEIPKIAEDSDALNHNSYIADCPIIVPKDVDFYDLLCQLRLYKDGSCKEQPVSTAAADTEINSYAIRWFNLASDRAGGRKERARAKEALNELIAASFLDIFSSFFPRIVTTQLVYSWNVL